MTNHYTRHIQVPDESNVTDDMWTPLHPPEDSSPSQMLLYREVYSGYAWWKRLLWAIRPLRWLPGWERFAPPSVLLAHIELDPTASEGGQWQITFDHSDNIFTVDGENGDE